MSAKTVAIHDISLDEDSSPELITKEKGIIEFLNKDKETEDD